MSAVVAAPPAFAEAVEGVEAVETRREHLREAKWWLTQWERHRDELARRRLIFHLGELRRLVDEPPPAGP